jgi:hypothetical protein
MGEDDIMGIKDFQLKESLKKTAETNKSVNG